MPSAKATLATLVLGGGGATAGAAMGGAFTPSSKNELPEGVDKGNQQGSDLSRVDSERRVDTPVDGQLNPSSPASSAAAPAKPPVKAKRLNTSNSYQGTFAVTTAANWSGKKYSKYLAGTEEDNKEWWVESFDRYQKDTTTTFSDDFARTTKVTSAFSTTDEKALNKVCEAVYKKAVTDITWDHKPWDQKSRRRSDFWKYCSVFKEKPLLVLEEVFKENRDLGKVENDLKKQVLSTKADSNNEVWKVKQEELNAEATPSEFFKSVKGNNDVHALRNRCAAAYKMAFTNNGDNEDATAKVKKENVLKYCSLEEPTTAAAAAA